MTMVAELHVCQPAAHCCRLAPIAQAKPQKTKAGARPDGGSSDEEDYLYEDLPAAAQRAAGDPRLRCSCNLCCCCVLLCTPVWTLVGGDPRCPKNCKPTQVSSSMVSDISCLRPCSFPCRCHRRRGIGIGGGAARREGRGGG